SEESRGEPNDNSTRGPFSTGGDFGDGDSTHSGGSGLGGAASSPSGGASSFPGGGSGGESTNGSGGTTEPGAVYAFPGAEGFGRDALGGRGGEVCHVTTLADSGAGSLRDCVSQPNRTVVFDVGGWITLSSNLGITQNNLTLAGQTAPGSGIGIRGRKVSVGGKDIVLRFLRVQIG